MNKLIIILLLIVNKVYSQSNELYEKPKYLTLNLSVDSQCKDIFYIYVNGILIHSDTLDLKLMKINPEFPAYSRKIYSISDSVNIYIEYYAENKKIGVLEKYHMKYQPKKMFSLTVPLLDSNKTIVILPSVEDRNELLRKGKVDEVEGLTYKIF